jgi:uncharacterized protein YbbC (DUF1343 family)
MLKMILNTEILTTGRETLVFSRSPLIILRAMKNAIFNFGDNLRQKYAIVCVLSLFFSIFIQSCHAQSTSITEQNSISLQKVPFQVEPGAYNVAAYLTHLKNKNIGIVGNQTSVIHKTHLVDSLLSLGITVVKVFSPEHGFRGDADAGEIVKSDVDRITGLPLVSLYGKNKKPTKEQLQGIDILVFDLQDVGVRFYTYISTLHYVMEACAENNIPLILLDRPNPNAHYIDGPIREEAQKSFIGMHPVPVVYGMTIGEYGKMINGEKWINSPCDLTVVRCENYNHFSTYSLPVSPSPNLRTYNAIAWYPSLCFFEGTIVSVGRGTQTPFEIAGHPDYPKNNFSFTPKPGYGAKDPLLKDQLCKGVDFTNSVAPNRLDLQPLIDFYKATNKGDAFFLKNNFFDLLAGNKTLRQRIQAGWSEDQIREEWKSDIEKFKAIRSKYLLY